MNSSWSSSSAASTTAVPSSLQTTTKHPTSNYINIGQQQRHGKNVKMILFYAF